ncbi:MAG: hypothetical protein ACM3IJ_05275 [Candidatus Levyibacteriota bacterium]
MAEKENKITRFFPHIPSPEVSSGLAHEVVEYARERGISAEDAAQEMFRLGLELLSGMKKGNIHVTVVYKEGSAIERLMLPEKGELLYASNLQESANSELKRGGELLPFRRRKK